MSRIMLPISLVIAAVYAFLSLDALADTIIINPPNFPQQLYYGGICPDTIVPVCATSVRAIGGAVGNIQNLRLPYPYYPHQFSVECVSNGVNNYYIVRGAERISCEIPKCGAGQSKLCGALIDIPAGTQVGDSRIVDIPNQYYPITRPPTQLISFEATCKNPEKPYYDTTNISNISCNDFACPETHVSFCKTAIKVDGGHALGDVFNVPLPEKVGQGSLTIQCLGNLAQAPTYQITDKYNTECY